MVWIGAGPWEIIKALKLDVELLKHTELRPTEAPGEFT